MLKFFLFISACLTIIVLDAQPIRIGIVPKVIVNKEINSKLALNTRIEVAARSAERLTESDLKFNSTFERLDTEVLLNYKLNKKTDFSIGVFMRFNEGLSRYRYIQQFHYTHPFYSITLSHRGAFEQEFKKAQKITYRMRYRLMATVPFSDKKVVDKTFYGKFYNEYIGIFPKNKINDLEMRLFAGVGYIFPKSKFKLEAGIDYRLTQFVQAHTATQNTFFIYTAAYVKL